MSAPTTLGELRDAVARVLVARGEAADGLYVDRDQWGVSIGVTVCGCGVEWIYETAPTCRGAVAAAWVAVVRDLRSELAAADRSASACRSQATRDAARVRRRKAAAALAAAREAGE